MRLCLFGCVINVTEAKVDENEPEERLKCDVLFAATRAKWENHRSIPQQ